MTRRVVASFIAVGLVVFATACTEPSPASGNRVLIVGDSLTDQSHAPIAAALGDAGWDPIFQTYGGTTIEDWAGKLSKRVAFIRPDVVVMELGTNDCGSEGCPDLSPAIDRAMRAIGDIPVLWLNIQDDAIEPEHPDYVNYAISQADARWPNLFPVDLAGRMRGHPEWRTDGLHFNDAGKQQLAALIVEALKPFTPVR
jgi:lysophospholipase L1-like esterase